MKSSAAAYCLKQCNKIGYYLQMLRGREIVRMKVTFYQDETGFIQLFNATDIWLRRDLYREATDVPPRAIDIRDILRFIKEAQDLEALKNKHFVAMVDQVSRELAWYKQQVATGGQVNENLLFDCMVDLNARISQLNKMSKREVLEELEKQDPSKASKSLTRKSNQQQQAAG